MDPRRLDNRSNADSKLEWKYINNDELSEFGDDGGKR